MKSIDSIYDAVEMRQDVPGMDGPEAEGAGDGVLDGGADTGDRHDAHPDGGVDLSDAFADVVSVPVGPLALSGWVRIEEEELPPGGIQVTARMGDQQFVTTTDAQGKYEIRDVMMSGVYKIQAGLPGYYAATHSLKVTQAVSYKVPDLTLRRWRILTDDPNPILGATMFNGSVVPYFTDLSPMGVYGKLWLYDVATDTSTLVDVSVSTDSGLLIEVPGSNLLLYTTNFQGTKSLLKVHGYRVDQRKKIFSFDRVLKPRASDCLLGDGVHLVFYAPDVTPSSTNGRHLWIDPATGAAQEFWNENKWIGDIRKHGDTITFRVVATSLQINSIMLWNTKTQTLTEIITNVQASYPWKDSENHDGGVLYQTRSPAYGAKPQFWLLRAGTESPQLVMDQAYAPNHFFSPDSQTLVTYGWNFESCHYAVTASCLMKLNLIELQGDAALVELGFDVQPHTWSWGPDSRYFLFKSELPSGGAELLAYERSTGETKPVSGGVATGRFALHEPSGSVAYVVVDDGQMGVGQLWLGDVHGTAPRLLEPAVLDEPMSFCPDGSAIAFRLAGIEGSPPSAGPALKVALFDDLLGLSQGITCFSASPAISGRWSPDSGMFVAMCNAADGTPAYHSQVAMNLAASQTQLLASSVSQSSVFFGAGGSLLTNICASPSDCSLVFWSQPATEAATETTIWTTGGPANLISDSGQRWVLAALFDSSTYGGESMLVAVDTQLGTWHVLPGSVTDYRRLAGPWMLVFLSGWGQEKAFVLLDLEGPTLLQAYGCPLLRGGEAHSERMVWAGGVQEPVQQCDGAKSDIHGFSSHTGQTWELWSGLLQHLHADSNMQYITFFNNTLAGAMTNRLLGSSTASDAEYFHLSNYMTFDFVQMAGNAALHFCRPPEEGGATMLCVARIP